MVTIMVSMVLDFLRRPRLPHFLGVTCKETVPQLDFVQSLTFRGTGSFLWVSHIVYHRILN